jgi:phosphatidylserine decarboxylase
MPAYPHHYIERKTRRVVAEKMISDFLVNMIYSRLRENAFWLFKAFTSPFITRLLGYLYFDLFVSQRPEQVFQAANQLNIDLSECLDRSELTSLRGLFERKIRYWENRPISPNPHTVVSPARASGAG